MLKGAFFSGASVGWPRQFSSESTSRERRCDGPDASADGAIIALRACSRNNQSSSVLELFNEDSSAYSCLRPRAFIGRQHPGTKAPPRHQHHGGRRRARAQSARHSQRHRPPVRLLGAGLRDHRRKYEPGNRRCRKFCREADGSLAARRISASADLNSGLNRASQAISRDATAAGVRDKVRMFERQHLLRSKSGSIGYSRFSLRRSLQAASTPAIGDVLNLDVRTATAAISAQLLPD